MKRTTPSVADHAQDWLEPGRDRRPVPRTPGDQGHLARGVDRLGDADDRMITFKQAFVQWQRAFDAYADGRRPTR